jgi:hypothetical protein
VVLVPLLACLGAPLLAYAWRHRPRLAALTLLAVAVPSLVIAARFVRDTWVFQRTFTIHWAAALAFLLLIGFTAVLAPRWRVSLAVALAGITVGWSVVVNTVQVLAPYSTTYWYGSLGTREAAAWLDANLSAEETYVASKEVALLAQNQRYLDQDTLQWFLGSTGFDGTWADQPIRLILTWEREPFVAWLIDNHLQGYIEVGRFGDYVVYQRVQ